MAGANDLRILRVPLDIALVNAPFIVACNEITIGRMDGPFQIRVGNVNGDQGWVQTTGWSFCDPDEQIDLIYVTAAAVPGGVLEFWRTSVSRVSLP
jgi:hypothetical protein